MKRLNCRLALLMALVLLLTPLSALAAELWDETYYRAIDYSDSISEAERESLDECCLAFLQKAQADLAVAAVTNDTISDTTLEDFARSLYEDCSFGYGDSRIGFIMVWNVDTDQVVLLPMNGGEAVVPQSYLDFTADAVAKYREQYGVYGPLYACTKMMSNYLERDPEEAATQAPVIVEERQSTADNGGKPAWYPADPSSFQDFHDPDAPRVVDVADIIPDEEEPALEARLAEIREELGKDLVIFTDVSTYGLERKIYAADFYDFNGYGIGDNFEGACLFVCMDPQNRGFWTRCEGPETMALYTEEIANEMDDVTYEYMKSGDYAEGFWVWAENFRRLYLSGSPFTPDWLLSYDPGAARTQNPDAPRVVDDAMVFSTQQQEELEAKAQALGEQYGMDVVICTARTSGSLTQQEYADAFYAAGGYGLGENYDGILLTLFKVRSSDHAEALVTLHGAAQSRIRAAGAALLASRCASKAGSDISYTACKEWLEQTGFTLRTGLAPRSVWHWVFILVPELLIGLGLAAFLLHRAKENMDMPAVHERANQYLDYDSIRVRNVADDFIRETVQEVYDPIKEKSSGGSSGGSGRSSYSSSYKSSSGRTGSGSGRSF